MRSRTPSLKQQMDAFTERMRAEGASWKQVAADYQTRYRLTPLQAFREAHRFTQVEVVRLWHERWPDSSFNERRLGAWEAWPAKSGNPAPLDGLENLARLYGCRAGDLIAGEDHGQTDDHAVEHLATDVQPSSGAGLDRDAVHRLLDGLPPMSSPASGEGLAVARLRQDEFGCLVAALINWADDMRRRDMLTLIASAATVAHVSPLLAHLNNDDLERLALVAATPSRIDEQTLGHIEAILQHAIHQEDVLGPHAVLETALAQYHLVHRLLASGPGEDVERRLTRLLADISRFIGWLLFNSGQLAGAEHFYGQARRAAHDADDDVMTSYVLAQWSHLATWNKDPRQGIEHSLGALAWATRAGSPALISYANDVGARAYAALLHRQNSRTRSKDHSRCRTAMSASRTNFAKSTADDPGRPLVYFFEPNMLDLTGALCHLDMGEPDKALSCAHDAITAMGTAFPRNRAFAHLYLSRAYAHKHEVGQAGVELAEAARLTGQHRSDRLVEATTAARDSLSPWARTDAVLQLDEQLRHYGLPTGRSSRT